jgi:hypothetical protein
MTVDAVKMLCAIDPHSQGLFEAHGFPALQAFLNRRTGAIVFLAEHAKEAEEAYHVPATEFAGQRAAVENRPSDWVEIPKYGDYGRAGADEVGFFRDFLAQVVQLAPGEALELS